jgi:acyl carrier protein
MTSSDDEVVTTVRTCWARILGIPAEEVDSGAHFFQSGGDSLLAVELVAVLTDLLDVEVPLETVLFDGTFAALSDKCHALVLAKSAP